MLQQPDHREPVEPPPSRWRLPSPTDADPDGIAGIGGDLEAGTLLAAYRRGLFPMPFGRRRIVWFSPNPRAIIPLDGLVVSRSLRRSMRRYRIERNTAFAEVMVRCGNPRRPGGWITPAFIEAYARLHHLGWAHSFECRDDDGRLVGGLYGVRVGRFFAGESMFHQERDASKVALAALVNWLDRTGAQLLDVQWPTPHLQSMGAITIDRDDYLSRLAEATTSVAEAPNPAAPVDGARDGRCAQPDRADPR